MSPQITGGELLLKCLKAEGSSMIFGVLDGSFNTWLAKLADYDMNYICPRHEAAGAHMAEAWARVRGETAITIGGIGPGAVNMSAGVAVAFAEGTPMITISGQRRRNIIYPDRGGAFQVVDLIDFYRPITKWQASVRDLRRMPELVRKAFQQAWNGRPGPVYLEIPEDIIRSTIDEAEVDVWPAERSRAGSLGVGDPAKIEQAATLLAGAAQPMLHAGAGVLWSEAWEEFMALGEYLGAGLTTSLAARGVVPEDHPRYFHPLNREALEPARAEADVLLTVGSRLGELEGWGKAPVWGDANSQTHIQIDVDPTSIAVNRPVEVGIVGDAKAVLRALLAAVQAQTAAKAPSSNFERYQKATTAWRQELDQAMGYGGGGINSGAMIRAVREYFPRDAIAVQDGGNTSLWSANYNPIYQARSYVYTAKFGHLGTGLPYAIGAKVAQPERQVYLISGDGAMGFNIQELETAARHNIQIVVVVACDQGWGMERSSQILGQVGAFVETELEPDTRYDLVARAFGCHGELVTELDQLVPALDRATGSGKPALVQVMVDQQANLAPPGALIFGSMVYRAED